MSFNPRYNFEEPGAGPPPRNDQIRHRSHGGPGYEHALTDLLDHMYEISDDPSGSDPTDYLAPEDAEVCRRVAALAGSLGWPNASELGRMMVPKSERWHVWKNPMHIAKAGLTKLFLMKEKGDAHRGYTLGTLGVTHYQVVALCEDGLLRSRRNYELLESKGAGWGRLPDADKLEPALNIGASHPVEWRDFPANPKPKTLAGKLLENVPGGLLDAATLDHFGLRGYKTLSSEDLLRENDVIPV